MKKSNTLRLILNKTHISKIGNTSSIYGGTAENNGTYEHNHAHENHESYDDGAGFSSWCTQESLNTGEVTAANNSLPAFTTTNTAP